jgi:ABC-type multidrug transport system ATPase subunit
MELLLTDISKHFGREVVFQGISLSLASGSRTAILGPNGSGKSTLLQLIGGALVPTSGSITHRLIGKDLAQEEVYRHVSIAAPYLGLYEDLSLKQAVEFHARFKPFRKGIAPADVARIAYLEHALEKPVLNFSSGMKQRLKLALAILSDTPLLLLDEPASNLDAEAIAWYRELLSTHVDGRTLLVASNRQAVEHDLCTTAIEISTYKGVASGK